jgi:hypothetical protein
LPEFDKTKAGAVDVEDGDGVGDGSVRGFWFSCGCTNPFSKSLSDPTKIHQLINHRDYEKSNKYYNKICSFYSALFQVKKDIEI